MDSGVQKMLKAKDHELCLFQKSPSHLQILIKITQCQDLETNYESIIMKLFRPIPTFFSPNHSIVLIYYAIMSYSERQRGVCLYFH